MFSARTGLIAGKPAPTRLGVFISFLSSHITCGSGLARDEASEGATESMRLASLEPRWQLLGQQHRNHADPQRNPDKMKRIVVRHD